MVNCSDCLSDEFIGRTSVPYNKTGKHFDFINENRTSSDALRPIFPKMLYQRRDKIDRNELNSVVSTLRFNYWLQRDAMHSADYAVARCLSVCPSVTRRYCVKTAEHILNLFSPRHLIATPF